MDSPPKIAVVIPTRNREPRLALALEALASQTLSPGDFEVFVVRDAGQKGPLASTPDGLRVRVIEHSGDPRAAAAKRNMGWRAAAATLIAFTDDDCRPAPDWLERLLAAQGEDCFLQGRTEIDPDEVHLMRGLARSQVVRGPSAWYPTSNMAYPRSLLERVGGFDEAFLIYGEDTDLALRAQKAGARCRYVDDAVVLHAVHSRTIVSAVRDAGARSWSPLLFVRHPEQRRHLYLFTFRNKSHAMVILAVAGGLLLRRRPALAPAALAPYIWHKLREEFADTAPTGRALSRLALRLPTRMLVEAIEASATIRSAIRHRTFFA